MKRLWNYLPLLIAAALIYVPFGGWKLLYGSQGPGELAQRNYGADYPVPGFEWAVVLNPQGVPTSDSRVGFFEPCLLRYRGTVRAITSHYSWYTTLSRDTLVEYRAPEGNPSAGALCPDGAVFLLPQAELNAFGARFTERTAYEAQLAGEVDAALDAPRAGPALPVSEPIRWVEAVNPQGLESFGYRIAFLDACGIEAGGTVQAIRATTQGMLYAYTPAPEHAFRGIGIPCPADTVFLQDGPRQRYF